MLNPEEYTIEFCTEDNIFVARHKKFLFLSTHGTTPEEAITQLNIVFKDLLEEHEEEC